MQPLAIVIPAYRSRYLHTALSSLAAQTCRHFTVYIGDDCSPEDLQSVIQPFAGQLDIHYHRFTDNMGATDLVGQWHRCINLTQREPWLWLFSDDDVMEHTCVEQFYEAQERYPERRFFHFNTTVIDGNDQPSTDKAYQKEDFPQILSATDYLLYRLTYRINSFVVEYIFHRSVYDACQGFVQYDLAWGADDNTWYNFATCAQGITTIGPARVFWRKSDHNISPNRNHDVAARKMNAILCYLEFAKQQLSTLRGWQKILFRYFLHALFNNCTNLSFKEVKDLLNKYRLKISHPPLLPQVVWAFILKTANKLYS